MPDRALFPKRVEMLSKLLSLLCAACLILLAPPARAQTGSAQAQETHAQQDAPPLRIAVYDVPPYGYVDVDGSLAGVSVDLWRRVADDLKRGYVFLPVNDIETILAGLEQGRFDAAIGAITITPDRAARVDFSFPAHRSGVALALRRDSGPLAAFQSYVEAISELGVLMLVLVVTMLLTGVIMWLIEKPTREIGGNSETSVVSLRDGLYWAIVTMTTVGYGDKTPKTPYGRMIAVLWMLGSVGLVSFISTSLVSRLTAERVETRDIASTIDLTGKRLAAAANSSGAEYLQDLRLDFVKYRKLPEALDALADGRTDAVINSVGALQFYVARTYAKTLKMPQGLLAPATMAIALPENSPLRQKIDRSLIKIVNQPEWRTLEDKFFSR